MRLRVREKGRSGRPATAPATTNGRVRRRQLNPRQRQGVLLIAVAVIGLIGVFVLIAGYVNDVSKQVGPKVEVLQLNSPVQQYQPLTSNMLGEVSVPAKWAPRNAIRDPAQVAGLVAGTALPSGTVLEQGMVVAPPALQPGEEEMSILVDVETGVAGQISAGSHVSIIGTYADRNSENARSSASARVVVPDARVLSVGAPTSAPSGASPGPGPQAAANGHLVSSTVYPVSFALTPEQVLAVSYAESFASKVRLSILPSTGAAPPKVPPYKPGL
jgi:pilus assembly protein CpaB